MPEPEPLLVVRQLSRSFGQHEVLAGLDAAVAPGEAVAVTGPNGSGKTTLLRCAAGTDHPTSGTVELRGRPLREHDPHARRGIAAVLDDVEFSCSRPHSPRARAPILNRPRSHGSGAAPRGSGYRRPGGDVG